MTMIRKDTVFADRTFSVATHYIPIGFRDALIRSVQIVGDGTLAATATVQHCDLPTNLDGSAIDPTVAGDARLWQPDTAVGTLTVAASVTVTGGARVSYGNQAALRTRIVLVVTVGGKAVIAGVGVQ